MGKNKSLMWIIMFLIMTASPVITYFFLGQYVDSDNYENRNRASRPILTAENYEVFPDEYEIYYNDNIPFRNQLIKFHNSIDYFLFHQSSNEDVEIGKNGWLFFSESGSSPIEQSLGYWNFTADQLQTIADNLVCTKRVLADFGTEFVLFIAPNKETIYIDELPDYYEVKSCYTSTDQLVDYLSKETDIKVIYPKQDLLEVKKETPDIYLYHKLDTHWNLAGAYIGARSLAKELGMEMPELNEILLEPKVSSSGDLTDMLNITIKDGDIDYDVSGINDLDTVNKEWDFFGKLIYHTDGAVPSKLFVRRDSFASAMAPSLSTQFANSLWVHQDSFDQQQIFDYGADVFVLEIVERNERGLENFRVSFLSSSVEKTEEETKKISLKPAIDEADLQYVSIFKKISGTENVETIQVMEPIREIFVLNVPEDESGEICIYIFEDELGEQVLEKSIVKY